MGKVDDMRAMREAKYAANSKVAPATKASKAKAALEEAEAPRRALPSGELCGHRSISNKACTREKDHQATGTKNHRYS